MKACPTCQQPAPDTDVCRHCWSTLESVDETTFGPMFTTRLVAYEPAPKPAQSSFSLREVEFEPAPWWRREGVPLLQQSLLVVLLIGLGLGGYWYYQNHQRQQQAEVLATHLSQAASFEKQENLKKAEQQLDRAVALSTHQAVRRQALLSRADFYYRHQ
ncbi:MAG: hypothetical protein KC910_37205, partial [Candidatus Eremiobacteraeota bacterium]|nr:hypothetical protein [Candidatus Eremiobacteraeota bacterium]